MPRLVTGLFYDRAEAQRAVEALKRQGIEADDIYVEAEVDSSVESGRKGGEIGRYEQERRVAGMEAGITTGLILGLLCGAAVGTLAYYMDQVMRASIGTTAWTWGPMGNPLIMGLIGVGLGLLAGAVIGCLVDYTLNRLGAGPPLPAEETLVTVRAEDGSLDSVYSALRGSRARHLHVADRAIA